MLLHLVVGEQRPLALLRETKVSFVASSAVAPHCHRHFFLRGILAKEFLSFFLFGVSIEYLQGGRQKYFCLRLQPAIRLAALGIHLFPREVKHLINIGAPMVLHLVVGGQQPLALFLREELQFRTKALFFCIHAGNGIFIWQRWEPLFPREVKHLINTGAPMVLHLVVGGQQLLGSLLRN